jgi:hypothetical protein
MATQKQALLVEVYKKGDTLKVRHLQISILKDFRTTAIAVRRVTIPTKLERPSIDDAKLRLFNLDSIRAPGKAQISMGLNAYEKADREKLEKRVIYTSLPSGTG